VYLRASAPQGVYAGHAACAELHPLLCLRPEALARPSGLTNRFDAVSGGPRYMGWSQATVRATAPMSADSFTSVAVPDALCAAQFGSGYRMAAFHDGGTGWGFIASGALDETQTYWVQIGDQPANPWSTR